MIVFEKDWSKFPTAIVDTKTKNTSFLRVASLFKAMGVKHYYFHLALIQPALQGVDPHDENLTLEQKLMILYECDHNPWYYLREIILIKGAGPTRDDCRYIANRGNIAAMWLMLACIDYIHVQPRQTGKSFGADCITLWLMYFCYRTKTEFNLITKDETLRKSNIARLKAIRDEWPDYLNRNSKRDDNNQISLSCIANETKLYTHVSQSSEKAANNLGRGMTSPFMQIDEPPFINLIELTVSAAMGAMNTARAIAERNGKPHCVIFTTTAGKQDDRDGKYMYILMQNAAVWDERFYDCKSKEELTELIKTNCRGRSVMVNLTMSHRQLGYTDEWLYEAIARARTEGENIDRDYFNIWTSGSKGSILTPELAAAIRKSEADAVDLFISKENYMFHWYENYDPNESYILNVDTSDAIGRDDIAVTLLKARNGAVCGAAAFNETNLIRFAQWLKEFLVKYKKALMLIERRYNAQVIIDYLLLKLPESGEDPFKRLYNLVVQDRSDRPQDYATILAGGVNRPRHVYDMFRKDFGFVTSQGSRNLLYSNVFLNAAKTSGHLVRNKQLIQQILGLVVKNNRIDHQTSGHDDMVISWLLGHWLLNYGLNLSHYGIDPTTVMIERARNGKELSEEEQLVRSTQKTLLAEIETVHNQLKDATSQMDIVRLEATLKTMLSRVVDIEDDETTLNALIEEANAVRREREHGSSRRERMLKNLGYRR